MNDKPVKKLHAHFNARADRTLKVTALGANFTHTITPNSKLSLALFRKAYTDVYQTAFPIKEEQMSLKAMIAGINARKIVVSVLGTGLNGPAPVLKGLAIGQHYPAQDVGLLSYLATAPKFQGQGLGRAMDFMNRQSMLRASQAHGKKLQGIFLECHLPGTHPDVMDPVKRIEIYEKWGAITLPIFYKQPPLEKGGAGLELKLLVEPHPATGKYPAKDAIKAYLTAIYEETQLHADIGPPEKNPDYLKSIQQLNKLDLDQFYKTTLAGRAPKPKAPRNAPK